MTPKKSKANANSLREVFIIWNPNSDLPPRIGYDSFEDARDVAKNMARNHPGQIFHVCLVMDGATAGDAPIRWVAP